MAFVRGYWALIVGILLLVIGFMTIFVSATFPTGEALVGTPTTGGLVSTTFSPAPGIALQVIGIFGGIILIAGWVGYRIGRHRGSKTPG
jgi:hypothetical protein